MEANTTTTLLDMVEINEMIEIYLTTVITA